jgi:hypothetical protein
MSEKLSLFTTYLISNGRKDIRNKDAPYILGSLHWRLDDWAEPYFPDDISYSRTVYIHVSVLVALLLYKS